ncbi:MAG: hypothetical protein PVJ26_16115, partial [Anaerolineae bacterium]
MSSPTDFCPWLGTEQDREIRHAEPVDVHICYAQQPPASIDRDHQSRYCLAPEHRACVYYREPPEPTPAPV